MFRDPRIVITMAFWALVLIAWAWFGECRPRPKEERSLQNRLQNPLLILG